MLMSGARSGNLDQVLARLAQVFSEDANMRMGRIIDSVEPVLAGFLTVSVGITPVSYTHLDVYKRQPTP